MTPDNGSKNMQLRCCFSVLITVALVACSRIVSEVSSSELIEIEKEIAAAVVASDIEYLDKILVDDFRFTHSTGDIDTKASWMEKLSENNNYTERNIETIEVELHGQVALTTGRIHVKTTSSNPRWKEYSISYIRLYEKREGHWRLLSHRSTGEETGPPQL